MQFSRTRGSLKLASPTKNLGDVSYLNFPFTEAALLTREYPRIDLVAIRKSSGEGRKPIPLFESVIALDSQYEEC
jgi:hypothetical protein